MFFFTTIHILKPTSYENMHLVPLKPFINVFVVPALPLLLFLTKVAKKHNKIIWKWTMVFHFCSRAHVPPFPTHYCDCDWFSVRFSYHSHWCLRSLIMHRSALSSCCRLHSSSRRSSPHGFTVVQCCLPPLLPRPEVLDAAWLDRARTQMDGFIFPTFFSLV